MRWLVQENLNSQRNYLDLVHTLKELNIPYLVLAERSGSQRFEILDEISGGYIENTDEILQRFIQNQFVMIYGGKKFIDMADVWGLSPGSFSNENFDFVALKNIYGDELLNPDFITGELFHLDPVWDEFFIRPTGNNKLFTGTKMSKQEFITWVEDERKKASTKYEGKTIMISPVKQILAEYRLFILNNNVVSASSYMVDGVFRTGVKPDNEALGYAKQMIHHFELSKAYVMDIAKTNDGYKIVEFNNLNSSGFYENDIKAIVHAIQSLQFSKESKPC